eukprot:CAMPEP_0194199860 /NCGR_PEP_ID=MMETSP0156-20130528/709_1 /TAXON_ID=33649 /ORGANISM="Thalassionema nitzschioides, Strain L26-B" /LENGTH=591 /DNA_ID=CAMNT_0038924803 /DNA_START=38 /DNA_END=1813 /DNA_ORIENTATION=+
MTEPAAFTTEEPDEKFENYLKENFPADKKTFPSVETFLKSTPEDWNAMYGGLSFSSFNEKLGGNPYTVCFMGTGNDKNKWIDKDPNPHDQMIPKPNQPPSYIPYQIWKDRGGITDIREENSAMIDGPAVHLTHDTLDPDSKDSMLNIDPQNPLRRWLEWAIDMKGEFGLFDKATGWSMPALAATGANKALKALEADPNRPLVFIGHSRGGVNCVLAAWMIYLYAKNAKFKNTPISIFAIDPVPGPTSISLQQLPYYGDNYWQQMFQLPPNVKNYSAIVAWDVSSVKKGDTLLNPCVPRPFDKAWNDIPSKEIKLEYWSSVPQELKCNDDPLEGNYVLKDGRTYQIIQCRGSHGSCALQSWCDEGKLNYDIVNTILNYWAKTGNANPHPIQMDLFGRIQDSFIKSPAEGVKGRSISSWPGSWSTLGKVSGNHWYTLFEGLPDAIRPLNAGNILGTIVPIAQQSFSGDLDGYGRSSRREIGSSSFQSVSDSLMEATDRMITHGVELQQELAAKDAVISDQEERIRAQQERLDYQDGRIRTLERSVAGHNAPRRFTTTQGRAPAPPTTRGGTTNTRRTTRGGTTNAAATDMHYC